MCTFSWCSRLTPFDRGGIALALGGARLLKSFLYGVNATDAITFTFITFLLLAIAFLACWIPARRASRVDPMIALRAE